MSKYVIDGETLSAIADSIRDKKGTTANINPENMPAEIASIETGGGDSTMEDGLITRTLTEYKNNRVAIVGSYALSNVESLEKVTLPMAETLGTYAFANDASLKRIDILGGGTLSGSITSSCLLNCENLNEIIMRNENAVTKLQSLLFPFYAGEANITRNFTRAQWNKYGKVGHLENWSGLTIRIKGSITYFTGTVTDEDSKPVWLFGQYEASTARLKTLALVETEEEANALMLQYAEQFADGGCKFYVPSSMVASYKSAANWSTYTNQIRAIEDYPEISG
ncbi:MAG: leucine-rich repeat protein [Clostridia bacterium]|nr:leucine-rich repeat protein [Clostridia bacterium]